MSKEDEISSLTHKLALAEGDADEAEEEKYKARSELSSERGSPSTIEALERKLEESSERLGTTEGELANYIKSPVY